MTKQTELKPCPFCGGKAELFEGYRLSHVYCTNCNAQTDSLKSKKRAAEEWERLGKEIDAEAEKANVIGIWEFKR